MRMVEPLRREIQAINRDVAARRAAADGNLHPEPFYARPRFSLLVLGIFACTGIVLVAFGVYGVLAYTVSQQTKEIAIRMALGGERGHVIKMVLRLGMQLVGAGLIIGVAASLATNRLLLSQLWNTSPTDPATFAIVLTAIVAIGALACWIPARRAVHVEPMVALRQSENAEVRTEVAERLGRDVGLERRQAGAIAFESTGVRFRELELERLRKHVHAEAHASSGCTTSSRAGRAERQLADEIASHLALLEDRFRAQGLAPDEARVAARRAFGGVEQVKELQRDARSFVWLNDAGRDARYAVRTLVHAPGFTLVAVFTLALGIGAVTIIYSVIHNVVLDPLPYRDSDRLVNVMVQDTQTGRVRGVFPSAEFLDFKEASTSFEDVVGTLGFGALLNGPEHAEILRGVWVTPNFFDFMGLPPVLGRALVADDGRPDAPPVAVLRHRAWVNYFAGDPDVVGKTIVLNGEPRTIVGVMPPRFTWHAGDVWIPRRIDAAAVNGQPTVHNLQARLKPGVTTKQAEAQLNLIAARRAREHPAEYPTAFQVQVVNVIEYTVGSFSAVLYTALAAVGLLLLIACCNVANMLLARATVREREMTVRAALGAGRMRILRQLLVESLLLGLSGAAAGCVFAYAGLDALVSLLPQNPLPGEVEIRLDGAALVVSLGTAVASALLFGIAPALYSARRDLVEGLKSGGKTMVGSRGTLRNALVAAEIALSLVLLLSAGLLMRTFTSLMRVDLGFNPDKLLVVPLAFAPGAYSVAADKYRFYDTALQRIAALPGVEAVAASSYVPPYDGPYKLQFDIPGSAPPERPTAVVQFCTEDYFRTLGIRIVRGGGLTRLAVNKAARTVVITRPSPRSTSETRTRSASISASDRRQRSMDRSRSPASWKT